MSSAGLAAAGDSLAAAWEKEGQVFWARIDPGKGRAGRAVTPRGEGEARKHPVLVSRPDGSCLLVWTEGTGWEKGGSLAWQVFDKSGKPSGEPGRRDGVPIWSFAAAWMAADGSFVIAY